VPSGYVKGICPIGWHIPTDAEWSAVTTYLGGESIAGGKMKETAFTHWNEPNTDATNSSVFTGLSGGLRGAGAFNYMGTFTYFWSSSKNSPTVAGIRNLGNSYANLYQDMANKVLGSSGRCLQDN
jgi:uncharacterized protein (TIGR02145 family)